MWIPYMTRAYLAYLIFIPVRFMSCGHAEGSLVNDKVSQSDKYLVCELQCMLELREHVKTMTHRWSALMYAVY